VKLRPWFWLVIALLPVVAPARAAAFVAHSESTAVVSEPVHDDLYVTGGTVTVTAPVDGDVVAAGGTIDLEGAAGGGVLAIGGTIRLDAPIGRSVRAAGGTLALSSRVTEDAVLAGGTVTIDPGAHIGRDLVVGAGTATVAGTVGRDAKISGGDVTIAGQIQGDAEVRATRITLLPTARIGGTLRYSSEQPIEIQPGAQVAGQTVQMSLPTRPPYAASASPRFWFGAHVVEFLALLVLGLVVVGVMPGAAATTVRRVREQFGRSLLIGFLLLVAVPVAAFLALFTIIGIPVSVVAMLLFFATLYPGQIFVAFGLGQWLIGSVRRRPERPPSFVWALVAGTAVLILLFAIPYVGWAFRLVAVLVGFGALWLTVWHAATTRSTVAS
jgi:hypothetical protein